MAFNLEKNDSSVSKVGASNNEKGNSKFDLNKSSTISNIEDSFDKSTIPDGSGNQSKYFILFVLFLAFGVWYFFYNGNTKSVESDGKTPVVSNEHSGVSSNSSKLLNTKASDQSKISIANVDSNNPQTVSIQAQSKPKINESEVTKDTIADKSSPNKLEGVTVSSEPITTVSESKVATIKTTSSSLEPVSSDSNIKKIPVTFDKSSSELSAIDKTAVKNIINILNKNNFTKITIEGFSSSEGNIIFNQQLSEARAKAFMSYLISNGISKERIAAIGRGIENPVASNETELERQKNRRVEIIAQ